MDSLVKRKIIASVLLFACTQHFAQPQASNHDLHTQSAAAVLAREFADQNISYLLLDADGQVMAQRWDRSERDIPVGSLTKPFMAVAYGRTHRSFPKLHCAGGKTCWLPHGHGTLAVREAIAFSCNSYFHQLIAQAGSGFRPAMENFALHGTGEHDSQQSFTIASPLALARAFLELTHHAREPEMRPVLEGLALSAQKGTAKAVDAALPGMTTLAKTGTAPCTHKKKAPGDGFALVMFPAEHPRTVLLVRLHGRPGFMAAEVAGRMIAKVEGGAAR